MYEGIKENRFYVISSNGKKALTRWESKKGIRSAISYWLSKISDPTNASLLKTEEISATGINEIRDSIFNPKFWNVAFEDKGCVWGKLQDGDNYSDTVEYMLRTVKADELFVRVSIKDPYLFNSFKIGKTEDDNVLTILGFAKDSKEPLIQSYLYKRENNETPVLSALKWTSYREGVSNKVVSLATKDEVNKALEKRVVILCKASVRPATDEEKAVAQETDRDLLKVEFKLVHANKNKNKDIFLPDEVEEAKATPVHKPINWEHTDRIIGVIIDSEYVEKPDVEAGDKEDEDPYLLVGGVIYQYLFPDYAEEMITRSEKDELYYSMETWFEEAEYQTDGQGVTIGRILKGLTFGGAGVVENPADVDAHNVSIGSYVNEEENSMKEKDEIVFDSQEELNKHIQSAIEEHDKAKGEDKDKKELEIKIVSLEKDNEKKDKSIVDLTEAKEKTEKEFEDFKNEIKKDEALVARLEELKEAGVDITGDDETKVKLRATVREMDDEKYSAYKVAVIASIPKPVKDKDDLDDKSEASLDVPNPSDAKVKDFSATREILNLNSSKEEKE